jgi:hypothetical protein
MMDENAASVFDATMFEINTRFSVPMRASFGHAHACPQSNEVVFESGAPLDGQPALTEIVRECTSGETWSQARRINKDPQRN